MPRAYCSKPVDRRPTEVRAFCSAAVIRSGSQDRKGLSQKTGICYSTLNKRLHDDESIGDMRLKEFWAILSAGKATDQEILAMVKGR